MAEPYKVQFGSDHGVISKHQYLPPHKGGYPCNYADLLGKVLHENPDAILKQLGIKSRLAVPLCETCSKPLSKRADQKRFCSRPCYHARAWISVVCDQCGKIFKRRASLVIEHMKHSRYTDKGLYCSRRCVGKVLGRKYGFGDANHPIHQVDNWQNWRKPVESKKGEQDG